MYARPLNSAAKSRLQCMKQATVLVSPGLNVVVNGGNADALKITTTFARAWNLIVFR